MAQDYWWVIEQQSRTIVAAHLAEAERERLARQAMKPARSARAILADALRAIAGRLDGETRPAVERQLSPAR